MDRTGTGLAPLGNGPHRAHLVGLDGRSMSGLAQMLVQRGFVVTGSVRTPGPTTDRLQRLGVRVHAGHSPRSVPRSARLLVYSPEVPREHPDRLSAARWGIEQASCPEVLARLLRRGVGVAATGGRKAGLAAAMVGWALTHAGLDPTVVLGTLCRNSVARAGVGFGPHVIVEAGDGRLGSTFSGRPDRPDPRRVRPIDPIGGSPPMGRRGASRRVCPGLRRRGGHRRVFSQLSGRGRAVLAGSRACLVGGRRPPGSGLLPLPGVPPGPVCDGGPAASARASPRPGRPGGGRGLRPGRPDLSGDQGSPGGVWRYFSGIRVTRELPGCYPGRRRGARTPGRGRGPGGRPAGLRPPAALCRVSAGPGRRRVVADGRRSSPRPTAC